MRKVFLAVGVLATCLLAWAQAVSTAQIGGAVRDSSGLAVPAAEVKATQTETGAVRSAQTAADGTYVLLNLPIGPYRLEVSKSGFSKFVQPGIVLQVNTNPTVDATLQVGSVTEQVTVEAGAALVETHSTGVGQVIDNQRILELPLNGRQPTTLVYLSGLAIERNGNDTANGGGNLNSARNYPTIVLNVAGGLSNGMTYLLDGGTHNDPYNNQNLPFPFPDALQEFKVETSGLPAQYGHHSAAAVNAVTKSGTNAFHGSAFEFFRNGQLNARNFFDTTRQTIKRNQFGGTMGGPIKRDKLFFFAGYQGLTDRTNPSSTVANIPTASMLAGDFRDIAACNGGRTLPASAGFQGNQIDPKLLNPQAVSVAQKLFAGLAAPDKCGLVNFVTRKNTDENIVLGRLDYQQSDKHSMFLRYEAAVLHSPTSYTGSVLSINNSSADDLMQSAVLGSTYVFGSSTVNAFRATFNRSRVEKYHEPFFNFQDLGIPVYSPLKGMVDLNVSGAFRLGFPDALPGAFNSMTSQVVDDVQLVRGSHQIAFGMNWIRPILNGKSYLNSNGAFTFSGQALTGVALVDFLLGKPSNFQQGLPVSSRLYANYIGLYVQDSWKVRPRFTVNYGVRWDPYLPTHNNHGNFANFDQSLFAKGVHSQVFKNAPAGLSFPGDSNYPGNAAGFSQLANFAPRLGLVWDPKGDGKMTVRAAYGIFYDLVHDFYYWGEAGEPPFASLTAIPTPAGGFSNPWQTFAGGNPFPTSVGPNAQFYPNQSYVTAPLTTKTTYVNQWNLSIQRQVGRDWLLSANYLGTSTIHLWTGNQANPAIYSPGASLGNLPQRRMLYLENAAQGQYFGSVSELDYGGTGHYNALLLAVQRRLSKGVTFQANYNWSHCISDLPDSELGIQGPLYVIPYNRKSSRSNCVSIDRRHVLNASVVAESPKVGNQWMKAVVGGWQISGIVRAQSGSYFDVTTGVDNALTGAANERPNALLGNPYASQQTVNGWFATDSSGKQVAFGSPAAGTYGNLGANALLGPGRFTIDLGLVRNFRIMERHSFQVRGEAFNLQNRLNAFNPVAALNNPNFGKIQAAADPRIVQLALKYAF